MSDTVETAVEAVKNHGVNVPSTVAAATLTLATYGAFELTKKTGAKIASIRENRQAKKALKESLKEQTTQS